VKLNYLDNEALSENIRKTLELRKGDGTSNWWRVYGLGEIGSLEGNVYQGWIAVDEIPQTAILKRYGVDFGWNDPTTVIAVYEDENKSLWLRQCIYQSQLPVPALIERCKSLPDGLFVCDNARPEIIAEMQSHGLRAIGSNKTAGEKMNGKRYNIELVSRRKIHYTRDSKELEQEFLTYAWRKKRTGEIIDEPEDGFDHAMDAIAYAVRDMERKPIEYAGIR
jgi:phage terminase large subunit